MVGLFFDPGHWPYVWYVVAWLAYVFIASIALMTLPLRK